MATIKFSLTPAVLTTQLINGATLDFISIEQDRIDYYLDNRMIRGGGDFDKQIPESVLSKVHAVFNEVFSLPLDDRQSYMKNNPSFEVPDFTIED